MPDREKVINAIECCIDGCLCAECDYEGIEGCWNKVLLTDALALLKEQPQIVRCKDCKHGTDSHDGLNQWVCIKPNTSDFYHDADWFCADGERRSEDA